jgi:putative phosphoribosyl transferase
MFSDRADAGRQLGAALKKYKGADSLVLGIPRGGVEVAYYVAGALAVQLSIIVVRKLPYPDSPEAGFGAVAEDGSLYFVPGADRTLAQSLIDSIVQRQCQEVARRIEALRNGHPLPDLRNRHIIVVDDGIAMGSTTQAAVRCCRNRGANRVSVAAPAASPHACAELAGVADEIVTLLSPPWFRAVADFYQNWYDVSDNEVVDIMKAAEKSGLLASSEERSD